MKLKSLLLTTALLLTVPTMVAAEEEITPNGLYEFFVHDQSTQVWQSLENAFISDPETAIQPQLNVIFDIKKAILEEGISTRANFHDLPLEQQEMIVMISLEVLDAAGVTVVR